MKDLNFRDIQKRTISEMESQIAIVRRTASDLSLVDYIRHHTSRGLVGGSALWSHDGLDALYEVSEHCRKAGGGYAPEGAWFPLAAFARDLTTTTDSGLVSLASTAGVRPGSKLQASLAVQSAVFGGATVLTGLTGSDFDLLAIETALDPSQQWHSEVAASDQAVPGFRPVAMAMKTIRFSLNVSRTVVMNGKLDVEMALREEIIRQVMAEIDRAAFIGAGGAAPAGLFGNAGLQVLEAGANGAAPTWAHLVELEYQVGERMGPMRSPCFITSPKLRKKLRTTQKATNLDFILADSGSIVMGVPLRATQHSPDDLDKGGSTGVCSAMLYGDLAELVIGFWGPAAVDISVDPVTRADRGEIRLHVRADVAVAPRNIGAFAAYKDLLAG